MENLNIVPDSLYNIKVSENFTDICRVNVALEVVKNLQYDRPVPATIMDSLKEKLDSYDSDNFEIVSTALKAKISDIEALNIDLNNKDNIKTDLETFCSELLETEVAGIGTEIMRNSVVVFEKFLFRKSVMEASPSCLKILFDEIIQYLFQKLHTFIDYRKKSILMENRAWGVYQTLSQRSLSQPKDKIGIWNSLNFGLQHKLETEIFQTYIKIFSDLIQYMRIYRKSCKTSKTILKSLESSLKSKISTLVYPMQLSSKIEIIDYEKQLEMLQNSVGYFLNLWDKSDHSAKNIEKMLLKNVEPTADIIVGNFEAYFKEHTNVS